MKKKSIMTIALLLFVGLTSGYVASTYAKYTATVEGEGTMTVAKWDFSNENQFGDGANQKSFTLDIKNLEGNAVDASTLVNGKIAPGTKGSFDVTLTNANSEVGVDFSLTVGDVTGKPTNLKFYSDSAHEHELTAAAPLTGHIAAGDRNGIATKIYWEWAYETGTVTDGIATGDSADTAAGEAAVTSADLTVPVTIKAIQHTTASATTTGLDQ